MKTREPAFCFEHGERKFDGKCSKCVWAGEATPNADLAKACSRTPAQQRATLMRAFLGNAGK